MTLFSANIRRQCRHRRQTPRHMPTKPTALTASLIRSTLHHDKKTGTSFHQLPNLIKAVNYKRYPFWGCGLYVQLNSHTNRMQTNRPIQCHKTLSCGRIWPSQRKYKWKIHRWVRNDASVLLYKVVNRLFTIHHLIFTNKKCKSAFKAE
jgi:hypothetical protein